MDQPLGRRALLHAGVAAGATALVPTTAGALSAPAPRRALPRRTVLTRQKFFGDRLVARDGAVRADRLVISWLGCTTYAVAFGGKVFLLDAWLPRGIHSGRVPTDVEEIADLRPAAIFLGHGHFDHARDSGDIARLSGAKVFGTAEHCQIATTIAGEPIRTRALGQESDPLGTVHRFRALGMGITAIRHPHSEPATPDLSDPHLPLLPVPDLTAILTHPPRLEDLLDTLRHLRDPEGGAVMYQFRHRGFRLLWNNSVGPVEEKAPEVPAAIRALPRSDVHLCAIQGFGQLTNGMRDVRSYADAARARLIVPGHHDDWAVPVIATQAAGYRKPFEAELAKIPARRRPPMRWMSDPEHYLRPKRLTFKL